MKDEEYWKWVEDYYDRELEHEIEMLENKIKHDIEMDNWSNAWVALFIISFVCFTVSIVKILNNV